MSEDSQPSTVPPSTVLTGIVTVVLPGQRVRNLMLGATPRAALAASLRCALDGGLAGEPQDLALRTRAPQQLGVARIGTVGAADIVG